MDDVYMRLAFSELGRRRVRDHEEYFERFYGGKCCEVTQYDNCILMYYCIHKIPQICEHTSSPAPRAYLAVKKCTHL